MVRKGTIKVMHGRQGRVTVQEDLGDTINTYSVDQWNELLEKRAKEDKEAKVKHDKADVTDKKKNPAKKPAAKKTEATKKVPAKKATAKKPVGKKK